MSRTGGGILSPKEIVPVAAPVACSTTTILMPWRKLGDRNQVLNFNLWAIGNDCYFVLERNADGSTNEQDPLEVLVGAAKSKPWPFVNQLDLYYQLSVHTLSPGFPAATAKFSLDGLIWRR